MSSPELDNVDSFWGRVSPLVLSQYFEKPRIQSILQAAASQEDRAEADGLAIRSGFVLSQAAGVQLDTIGALYKEPRTGRTDEAYRLVIQAKAATAINGNPEEILKFLTQILGYAGSRYIPDYPAGFRIAVGGTSSTLAELDDLIRELSPAGVQSGVAMGITEEDSPFDLILSEEDEWIMAE